MSVLLLALLAVSGGLATMLLAGRRRIAFGVGLVTAFAALGAAAAISAEDTVPLAGAIVGGSDGLRTLAAAWAAMLVLAGLLDALAGDGPIVLGSGLIGLGLGVTALAVSDAGIGLTLLTAGGLATVVVPIGQSDVGPSSRHSGRRAVGGDAIAAQRAVTRGVVLVRPVLAAGALGLLVIAWGASPVGPFAAADPLGGADPALQTAMGIALLGAAAAIAIRSAAIPAHAWAARFSEAVPATAIPAVLGFGAAATGIVLLGWLDVTIGAVDADLGTARGIILGLAALGIVLAGIAAVLHDDLEHILAYGIVQGAGIGLLAVAIGPDAGIAGRTWLAGSAAVAAAFALWIRATRATFDDTHRLGELGGWARQAPILGVGLALVLAAATGLPGMTLFDARVALIDEGLADPVGLLVQVAAFAPLLYVGRILAVGLGAASPTVRAADPMGSRGPRGVDAWTADRSSLRGAVALVRARRIPLAGVVAIGAAAVALGGAISGIGG